jgi:hypothetical protein
MFVRGVCLPYALASCNSAGAGRCLRKSGSLDLKLPLRSRSESRRSVARHLEKFPTFTVSCRCGWGATLASFDTLGSCTHLPFLAGTAGWPGGMAQDRGNPGIGQGRLIRINAARKPSQGDAPVVSGDAPAGVKPAPEPGSPVAHRPGAPHCTLINTPG